MAFGVGFGADQDESVLADINVTPLVDVMLVLLIIFMITAPMLHQGIEVALPKAEAEAMQLKIDDPIVLSINRDGIVYIQEEPVHPTQLMERLLPLVQARQGETVFLKGDRDLPYGQVVELLDILHRGGIEQIGMVTERPKGRAR
jgi:biopolymer transport protein TolR